MHKKKKKAHLLFLELISIFSCLFKWTLHDGFYSLSACLVCLVVHVLYAENNHIGRFRKQQIMAYMNISVKKIEFNSLCP